MITLSNFSLGGGSIVTPSAPVTGGVKVSASPLSIVMVDSSFFQDIQLTFTPGSVLSFQYDSTSNPDALAPDTFTLAILDNTKMEIPTTNPSGLNSFVEIDLPTMGSGTQVTGSGDTGGSGVAATATVITACDVRGNPSASIADVQRIVDEALGTASPVNDVNSDGLVNTVDIQLVIDAVMGQGCPVS